MDDNTAKVLLAGIALLVTVFQLFLAYLRHRDNKGSRKGE